jgi:hypothetical protein
MTRTAAQVGEASFLHGINVFLASVWLVYFLFKDGPYTARDAVCLGTALAIFGFLGYLSYGSDLRVTNLRLFIAVYSVTALLMLALVGHSYEPTKMYYLAFLYAASTNTWRSDGYRRWWRSSEDFSRTAALGCAVALMQMLVRSYGEIFGSLWLFRGWSEQEEAAAARYVQALASQSPQAPDTLRAVGERSALHVMRGLVKMELVRLRDDGPHLSVEGERLTGISNVL